MERKQLYTVVVKTCDCSDLLTVIFSIFSSVSLSVVSMFYQF